jgi:hypothetical protein
MVYRDFDTQDIGGRMIRHIVIVSAILPICTGLAVHRGCVPMGCESAQNLHWADGAYVASHDAKRMHKRVQMHCPLV